MLRCQHGRNIRCLQKNNEKFFEFLLNSYRCGNPEAVKCELRTELELCHQNTYFSAEQ